MQKVFNILSVFLISVFIYISCSENELETSLAVFGAKAPSETCSPIPKFVKEKAILVNFPEPEIITYPIEEHSIVAQVDMVEETPEPIVEDLEISDSTQIVTQHIDEFISDFEIYEDYYTANCNDFRVFLESETNEFFMIINEISIQDTANIKRLVEMESFLEVLSPQIEEMENMCPDLYNDYMEHLDEYTLEYYDKLELLF